MHGSQNTCEHWRNGHPGELCFTHGNLAGRGCRRLRQWHARCGSTDDTSTRGAQRTCRALGFDPGTHESSVFSTVVSHASWIARDRGRQNSKVGTDASGRSGRFSGLGKRINVPRNETSPPERASPLSTRVSHAAAHGRSRTVASRVRSRHHAARDARTRRERRPEGEVGRGRERPGGRGRDGC